MNMEGRPQVGLPIQVIQGGNILAKTNKEAVIKLCNEINKKEGEGSIYSIGSKHANLKINRWSTGIEDLDAIIGGGNLWTGIKW